MKVRVLKFVIFFEWKFNLYKKKINGTDFILGWIPIGGYVTPYKLTPEEEEEKNIIENNTDDAFFKKKITQKILFFFSQTIIILIFGILLPYLILKYQNSNFSLFDIKQFFSELSKTIFGGKEEIEKLGELFRNLSMKNNKVLFTFLIYLIITFPILLLFNLNTFLQNNLYISKKILNLFGFINFIFNMIFLWKSYQILLQYFDILTLLRYITNILIGTLITGIIAYFIIILIAKLIKE